MRWPFGARKQPGRGAESSKGWAGLRVGDTVAAGRRGPGEVRGVAVYDARPVAGQRGDGRTVALVWLDGDGAGEVVMSDHDFYGGPDAFDVETLRDLEPIRPEEFAALSGRLVAGEELETAAPGGERGVGEPEPVVLARAEGAAAAGCPARGWLINLFRAGSEDVMFFWLVVLDDRQIPRLAFEGRTRQARTPTW